MKKSKKVEDLTDSSEGPISHDTYFRKNFSDIRIAKEYLIAFLPNDLLQHINLETLQHDETSYVDEQYKKMHSDVVYQAQLTGNKQPTLTISFLFEHKSRQPANIYLQLLSYIVQVWQRCAHEKRPLSFVLPIVVYHGRRSWQMRSLQEYFKGLPEVFLPYLPDFRYHLTDLASTPNSVLIKLQHQQLLQHVLSALKFAGLNTATEADFGLLLIQTNDPDLSRRLIQSLIYLFSHLPETNVRKLEHIIEQKQAIMTTVYQSLVNKGKKEGRQEGRIEGRQEGLREGQQAGQEQGLKTGISLTLAIIHQLKKYPAKSDAQIAEEQQCEVALVQQIRATL